MQIDGDWEHLGRVVAARRVRLGLNQQDVAQQGGPGTGTMVLIENARKKYYRPRVLASLEHVLGWRRGSIHRILNGGEPELDELATPQQSDSTRLDSYLLAELTAELTKATPDEVAHVRAYLRGLKQARNA